MNTPQSNGGPIAHRIQVGAQLRQLREARGLTRAEAGWAIRGSESKISRIELGRVGFKERDVVDLLRLYGVEPGEEHSRLLAQVREANAPGWWQGYSDVLAPWFQNYLDLEQAAELIRTYEVQFVPGLLQTEAYARAVINLGHGSRARDEIDRRVELRMARATVLTRPEPPRLWAVLDEAVLRRPIGGADILRGQIEALLAATDLPNVRLQVIPFRAGGHPASGGAFSILRFPHPDMSDVVYLEYLTSALYLDKEEDVDLYAAAIGQLFIEAEPPQRTPDLLRAALRDLAR
ncbi:Helix-turn-helix domain-containing protein [Cryptosporangium aurantiacum]|uniref:Helix-turn-helix domain-containing protein n=1 Tax=Cryptosporangium aurantiacum TaxID=134849 RepID=A0A1M7TU77_9ACTN|nr:helix-turn-helix transcriptional regulator [Cryptosporangium aurantiacum]SHN74309.1 Helix-turn-helix domain-containing protein [Cryptosporangium aurantiacum]